MKYFGKSCAEIKDDEFFQNQDRCEIFGCNARGFCDPIKNTCVDCRDGYSGNFCQIPPDTTDQKPDDHEYDYDLDD